jgi:hypothetical protein
MVSLAASLEVPVGDLLIASGWFNEEHFVTLSTSSSDADNGKLEAVLAEIEDELDEIRDLERQAEARARKLSAMIRDLKATAGLSVSMVMAAD